VSTASEGKLKTRILPFSTVWLDESGPTHGTVGIVPTTRKFTN
jgi:hypothetical protein